MKIKLQITLPLLVWVMYTGCKKDKDQTAVPQNVKTIKATSVKNPYSVKSMRKAMSSLLMKDVQLLASNKQQYSHGKIMATSGTSSLTINQALTVKESVTLVENAIVATHYYIKFLPANNADYAKLKVDSNLLIYPFPLDQQRPEYNGSYRDPLVAAGVPTYQYAAVPVNYVLPNVPYVKLEDLYLPDESSVSNKITLKGAGNSSYTVAARELSEESFCDLAENDPTMPYPVEDCDDGTGTPPYPDGPYRNGVEWRPNGRITVYDDVLNQTIGVEGIRVKAYRWFTTYSGITDADGYYAVDGWFTRPANYWFQFERYDFSVNDHSGGPQEVSGPKIETSWNIDLTNYNKFCATIFRAAHHYYYKDIQGLRRPPLNSFWGTQVKIGAFDETHVNNTSLGRTFLFGELIKIYSNPGSDQSSADLNSTTIHELAHAVHWQIFNPSMSPGTIFSGYSSVDDKICESWSRGAQWALTKMVYPDYAGGRIIMPYYTNIIADLIDTSVEISYPSIGFTSWGYGSPNDQVEGYTILQIENSLIGETDWDMWKGNIKNLYNNGTEQHLDALFASWSN